MEISAPAGVINKCRDFVLQNDIPKYLFGINKLSDAVAERIDIEGFVDEFTTKKEHKEKPVIHRISDLPENSLVLICMIGIFPVTVQKKLEDSDVKCIDYFSFLKYSGLELPEIEFWKGFNKHYKKNTNKYNYIQSVLSDEISVDTYNNILNFRLEHDLRYMHNYSDRQHSQYFEDFLLLKKEGEVFVDIGGYDGQTSMEFIKRYPDYSKILLFEPDQNNLKNAKERLSGFRDIEYFSTGLSNKLGKSGFAAGNGSVSKVSDSSDSEIVVDTLDNLYKSKVTYIKMDIEGSEIPAIEGAAQTILKYHPHLAICVYHKGGDLVEIPEKVFAIRKDYNLYLRHYTEGVVETVMYFIPKG